MINGPDGPVWLQVSPPESSHESEVGGSVHLGCPLVMDRVVRVLRERGKLLRMVENVCDHRIPVLPGGLRIAEDLLDIVLVHGDGVRPGQPGVQISLGHRPALGVHAGCELHPALRRLGTPLPGGRDELVLLSRRNPP